MSFWLAAALLFFFSTCSLAAEVLPFWDLESGCRVACPGLVLPWPPPPGTPGRPLQVVGCGQPFLLRWSACAGAAGQLLSFRDGTGVVRRPVDGQDAETLQLACNATGMMVEALRRPGTPGGPWRSRIQELPLAVRGVLPLAGDPGEPGHRDGPGGEARFAAPCGLAVLGGGLYAPQRIVVADPVGQVLRTVSPRGRVSTLCGVPGEAGCQDGTGAGARLRGPTYLAALPAGRGVPWRYPMDCLVSDSGNHVLRRVTAGGAVATVAGVPGQAGFRDAEDPRQALFDDPQGLAVDRDGNLFVADRGNHVVRRVFREGPVTVLAGEPGAPGSADGQGRQARFGNLKGLALARDGALYVADGHAVRRITLDGQVTTVLGDPVQGGFQDDWASGSAQLAGVPCLRDPAGLWAAWDDLYIADRGNHAVRVYHRPTGTLQTLAGDPALAEPRWGLLRDGIHGPLALAYGALPQPQAVAALDDGALCVATGAAVAQLCRQYLPEDAWDPPRLQPPEGPWIPGEPRTVNFMATPPRSPRPARPLRTFLDPDGTQADRCAGTGLGDRTLGGAGRFRTPGLATLRLLAVTDQGWSVSAEARVVVAAPAAQPP